MMKKLFEEILSVAGLLENINDTEGVLDQSVSVHSLLKFRCKDTS